MAHRQRSEPRAMTGSGPVVVMGGTGYLGLPLLKCLYRAGLDVHAVARPSSLNKVPWGCCAIAGDVLDSTTYREQIARGATVIHLVGAGHPSPWKQKSFRALELPSLRESVAAAKWSGAEHFVYVSTAQPAPLTPLMKTFVNGRRECEQVVTESGLNATILRPWYVLSPGHSWPFLLLPFYKMLEAVPATRKSAIRMGLVRQSDMVAALFAAVQTRPVGVRFVETAGIRAASSLLRAADAEAAAEQLS